jgi:hypothetical protein
LKLHCYSRQTAGKAKELSTPDGEEEKKKRKKKKKRRKVTHRE